MPELPEVEVLVQHLNSLLPGLIVEDVQVLSERFIAPHSRRSFQNRITGSKFIQVQRRGKYLLFHLVPPSPKPPFTLYAHLGMSGRIHTQKTQSPLPSHTRLRFSLRSPAQNLVFHDPRGFGGCSLNDQKVSQLGPEPWDLNLTPHSLLSAIQTSRQPIKTRLLDQSVIAGIGNIYACEILHQARISPLRPSQSLRPHEIESLLLSARKTLKAAIELGLSLSLDFAGGSKNDGLFYYGSGSAERSKEVQERFAVYDREGLPCRKCGSPIVRVVQAARSSYYCKRCQA